MNKISTMILATVVFLSSCSKELITGSGTVSTRTLSLPAFASVESHYDIRAVVTYGTDQEVKVTGYDNLLNIADFKVENGVLKLKFNSLYNTIRNGNVTVNIELPYISAATIHGSGNIQVNNFANGDVFNARIHGSGDIKISNSGYQLAVVDIYGSGDVDAQGLLAKQVQANVFGSGNTRISVSNKLLARIYGSGDIFYWGNPLVEEFRNGSGRIVKQ